MSLSFVSSAILSSSDGVSHNEEQNIESTEANNIRSRNTSNHVPLFEQIKSNKDVEQEKFDAESKIRQMGSRGLDEEDCAHLESVESIREEKERLMKKREMEEVGLFRAARAERSLATATTTSFLHDDDLDKDKVNKNNVSFQKDKISEQQQSTKKSVIVAPIIIKKKRRINNNDQGVDKNRNNISNEKEVNSKNTAISLLLGAYDSDSSDNESDD